jgi:hypothetical protein
MALFAVGNFSGAADGTALSTADPNFVIHPFTSGAVATVESGRIVATATGNSIYYHSGKRGLFGFGRFLPQFCRSRVNGRVRPRQRDCGYVLYGEV